MARPPHCRRASPAKHNSLLTVAILPKEVGANLPRRELVLVKQYLGGDVL